MIIEYSHYCLNHTKKVFLLTLCSFLLLSVLCSLFSALYSFFPFLCFFLALPLLFLSFLLLSYPLPFSKQTKKKDGETKEPHCKKPIIQKPQKWHQEAYSSPFCFNERGLIFIFRLVFSIFISFFHLSFSSLFFVSFFLL